MSVRRQGTTKPGTLWREHLELWLGKLDPPAPGVSMIDGFLAALAAGPRKVNPDVWMCHILGDQTAAALKMRIPTMPPSDSGMIPPAVPI